MNYLHDVAQRLEQIRASGRYRTLDASEARVFADFSTNDYLGLAADPRMVEALKRATRVGSGGARLLGGRHREHALLEEDLSKWLGRERTLLFSSGYLAAGGAVGALAPFVGVAYSDALNHACLIDALRTAKVERVVYPHRALPPRTNRRRPALIVTESIYGMDGDIAPLEAMLADLNDDDILLVDDAHALGIAGPDHAGLAQALPDERVVVMGTLGKAIGAAGGFVSGPAAVVELLVNTARTFIFDTALPPSIALAARVGILLARQADDRRARLHANVRQLREGLRELGLPAAEDRTPIVPIVLGDEARALAVSQKALTLGVSAPAIRPPTVPPGTSRLRISVRADHTPEQIARLLEVLACSGI
ncbi:MAG: 8-amino-7-oxononanoate synthase [Candidatus Eremiobacteraeota bacterium]|nr:8-amino-7-oxononanoate synthase [Candidatus Eremiobacteraeota bacterium]